MVFVGAVVATVLSIRLYYASKQRQTPVLPVTASAPAPAESLPHPLHEHGELRNPLLQAQLEEGARRD